MKNIFSRRKLITISVIVLVLLGITSIVSRLYFDKPQPNTAAMIEERNYYVVSTTDGKDSLYVYAYHDGDTLLALPTDTFFLRRITRYRPSSWVNRWWLPSCFGSLAAKIDASAEKASKMQPIDNAVALSFLQNRYLQLQSLLKSYRKQLSEIDYYIRRHSVGDEGFDIVARRRKAVCHEIDSVNSLLLHAKPIIDAKSALTRQKAEFTIVVDSMRIPAHQTTSYRKGYLFFAANNGKTPKNVRPVYAQATDIGKGLQVCKPLVDLPDTIISGFRNVKGRYQGMVTIHYPDGSYYEGQCIDTLTDKSASSCQPDGFGVGFSKLKVKAGLWKSGKYKGEQPVYTSAHIYGIDISRYQHEPAVQPKVRGRKRRRKVTYPIEWSKLRISSLGSLSKKRVNGSVDYPISFIYIKCSEGKSLLNRYYSADYASARKHGYRVGAYHFFSTKVPVSQQVALFVKNCRYNRGDLPPALDVEPTTALINKMGGAEVMLSAVRKWLVSVERQMGVRPILYISQTFINRYLTDRYADGQYLRDNYQVWIARYGEYKPDVHLAIWQLSPDGRVRGIRGEVDINVFNGYDDLFKEFK